MNEPDLPLTHCPNCQGQLRERGRFCPACGTALDDAAPPSVQAAEQSGPASGLQLPDPQPEAAPAAQIAQPAPRSRFDESWSQLKVVGYLYGAFLVLSLLANWVGANDTTPWSDVGDSIAEVVLVFVFAGFCYRDVIPLLGLPKVSRLTALKLLLLSVSLVLLLQGYFYVLVNKFDVEMIKMTESYQDAGWGLGWMLLFNSVTPALSEELAFRGIIQTRLERVVGVREALLIQAALFSVGHLLPMIFISHFLMGLTFGYLRLRTRSIYPGMALHGAWNAFVVLQEVYLS